MKIKLNLKTVLITAVLIIVVVFAIMANNKDPVKIELMGFSMEDWYSLEPIEWWSNTTGTVCEDGRSNYSLYNIELCRIIIKFNETHEIRHHAVIRTEKGSAFEGQIPRINKENFSFACRGNKVGSVC